MPVYIQVEIKECLRCGHHWQAKVENPVQCPACKSVYWNKPRQRKGDE